MERRFIAASAGALLLLTGCGGNTAEAGAGPRPGEPAPVVRVASAGASTSTAEHNSTDVMFAQVLLAYEQQARKVAPLAAKRATRAEVRTLVAAMDATQADEARTLEGWLRAWGQPVVASRQSEGHDDHGGVRDLTDADVAALAGTKGAAFDGALLRLLLGHQHNMVEIARTEATSGKNPQARELAGRVVASRTAQVRQMLAMLDG